MSKQKRTVSEQTVQEAEAIAKATQQPGQNKAQTKLIAKGIEKGIAEYKKRQKSKSRELDKKLRKVKSTPMQADSRDQPAAESVDSNRTSLLPWILLLGSWILFVIYYFLRPF